MTVEIIETVGAWMVVDKSLPGWRLLEQHGQRHLAEAALERYQTQTSEAIACDSADELAETLVGNVAIVGGRIGQMTDVEQLADLARLEQDGLGRRTILSAIERRCRVLQRQ